MRSRKLGRSPSTERSLRDGAVYSIPAAVGPIEELTGVRVHRSCVWRWFLSGRLKGYRVGGRAFVTRKAIEEMLQADADRPATTLDRAEVEARGNAAAERITLGMPPAKGGR